MIELATLLRGGIFQFNKVKLFPQNGSVTMKSIKTSLMIFSLFFMVGHSLAAKKTKQSEFSEFSETYESYLYKEGLDCGSLTGKKVSIEIPDAESENLVGQFFDMNKAEPTNWKERPDLVGELRTLINDKLTEDCDTSIVSKDQNPDLIAKIKIDRFLFQVTSFEKSGDNIGKCMLSCELENEWQLIGGTTLKADITVQSERSPSDEPYRFDHNMIWTVDQIEKRKKSPLADRISDAYRLLVDLDNETNLVTVTRAMERKDKSLQSVAGKYEEYEYTTGEKILNKQVTLDSYKIPKLFGFKTAFNPKLTDEDMIRIDSIYATPAGNFAFLTSLLIKELVSHLSDETGELN